MPDTAAEAVDQEHEMHGMTNKIVGSDQKCVAMNWWMVLEFDQIKYAYLLFVDG